MSNEFLKINETTFTKSELRILEHMTTLVEKEGYIILDPPVRGEVPNPEERKADFQIKLAIIRGKLKTMRKSTKY